MSRTITLRRLIDDYRTHGMSHLAPNTAEFNSKALDRLARLWGDRHAHRVEPWEIQNLLAVLGHSRGYERRKRDFRVLSVVYEFGIKRGRVSVNPVRGVVPVD